MLADTVSSARVSIDSASQLPFHVVGVSRDTVDTSVIGQLGAAPQELIAFATHCRAYSDACVVLGTCHRVELYWMGEADLSTAFRLWLDERCGPHTPASLEVRHGDDALSHLFAVAAGLRAQRIGEPEILGQVRRAWMLARDERLTSPALDALMQRAILAARQIRRKAGFADREASLGDAAVSLLSREIAAASWHAQHVLVIGSGVAADSTLRALRKCQPASTTVISRTDSRALALATTFEIVAAPWSMRLNALQQSDVVIFATRSAVPVVSSGDAQLVMRARTDGALWLDLGVPPNVAQDVLHARLRTRSLADLAADVHDDAAAVARHALEEELARFAIERRRRMHGPGAAQQAHDSGFMQIAI